MRCVCFSELSDVSLRGNMVLARKTQIYRVQFSCFSNLLNPKSCFCNLFVFTEMVFALIKNRNGFCINHLTVRELHGRGDCCKREPGIGRQSPMLSAMALSTSATRLRERGPRRQRVDIHGVLDPRDAFLVGPRPVNVSLSVRLPSLTSRRQRAKSPSVAPGGGHLTIIDIVFFLGGGENRHRRHIFLHPTANASTPTLTHFPCNFGCVLVNS